MLRCVIPSKDFISNENHCDGWNRAAMICPAVS